MDIIKGWTRSTCVATILAAASEVDVTSEGGGIDLLKPITGVLDKCWLIPVHVTRTLPNEKNVHTFNWRLPPTSLIRVGVLEIKTCFLPI